MVRFLAFNLVCAVVLGDNWVAMSTSGGTTSLSFLDRLQDQADTRAWTSFHQTYGELLLNYAERLGASRETAEDVAQEVEMYVFRAMKNFQHQARKGCFRAYLRSAVVHALGRRAQQSAHRERTLDPSAIAQLAETDAGLDAAWVREHYLHRIRCAMRATAKEFEPITMEAFHLHALEGHSVADTAERLGISPDSVYQAKSRVIRRLREHIAAVDSDVHV